MFLNEKCKDAITNFSRFYRTNRSVKKGSHDDLENNVNAIRFC